MKRLHTPAGVVVLCLAAHAFAAEFVAVNVSPSPDTLHRFDTVDPAAAGPAISTLAGNYVRGLDLTADLNGYYVATDYVSGSPTGFYQLQDGVSTKITDMPFLTGAVGGLTLNHSATALFAALDPPDARPDTLFSVDFLGNFVEIGPIALAGYLPAIAGLAVDPVSGALYGLDNETDSLLLIDQATGAATKVGNGLGITVNAVGGLDFAFDGSGLYAATDFGRIYRVDTTTGLAGPLLGQLPFNASSIAAIPEPAGLLLIVALLALRRR